MGRIDSQVKIHGHRIELAEIENVLHKSSLVNQCAVVVSGNDVVEKRIVGYVVPQGRFDKEGILDYLKFHLPGYMIPQILVEMRTLPLTPNGKVDKKALPDNNLTLTPIDEYVTPRNEVEEKLLRIWKGLVHVENIGVKNNFFDIGGYSLLAVKLMDQINATFSLTLPISVLFLNPTIESIAEQLSLDLNTKQESVLVPIQKGGTKKPIFCAPGSGGNVTSFFELSKQLGADQPVFAFQSHGLLNNGVPLDTVEEMATSYIEEMQKVEVSGPYNLAGYSFGGKVVYEMAIQLQQKGFKVNSIILFEARSPDQEIANDNQQNNTFERWLCNTGWTLASWHGKQIDLIEAVFENHPEDIQFELLHAKLRDVGVELSFEQMRRFVKVYIKNVTCLYQPSVLDLKDVSILVIKASEKSSLQKDPRELVNPDYGWQKHTSKKINVAEIESTHLGILNKPAVVKVAQVLVDFLSSGD